MTDGDFGCKMKSGAHLPSQAGLRWVDKQGQTCMEMTNSISSYTGRNCWSGKKTQPRESQGDACTSAVVLPRLASNINYGLHATPESPKPIHTCSMQICLVVKIRCIRKGHAQERKGKKYASMQLHWLQMSGFNIQMLPMLYDWQAELIFSAPAFQTTACQMAEKRVD